MLHNSNRYWNLYTISFVKGSYKSQPVWFNDGMRYTLCLTCATKLDIADKWASQPFWTIDETCNCCGLRADIYESKLKHIFLPHTHQLKICLTNGISAAVDL